MYFAGNLEQLTISNNKYRKVLFTGRHSQLVVMSLKPLEEIGSEIHQNHDQFIRVEKGICLAQIGSDSYKMSDGDAIVIPAGMSHNIINYSQTLTLKLYTIYSPPEHPVGTIQESKPQK